VGEVLIMRNSLELRFFEFSIDNCLSIFRELLYSGKKHFLIRGINQDAIEFVKKAKEYSHSFHFYAVPESYELSLKGIIFEYDIKNIEAIFLFITNANMLSTALMDYVHLRDCVICAPITRHYYKNRFIFVISIPKAGSHMLLKLIQNFGFYGPGDINNIKSDGSFYYLTDRHTEISYFSAFHGPSRHVELFFTQPALFVYRDPRDIAVSLSHFLSEPPTRFLSEPGIPPLFHPFVPYFKSLPSNHERLKKAICGAPVIGSIRDFVMPFAGWLEMPNIIPIRFEDLVGPNGGGSFDAQFETILKLQLKLHAPGRPLDFMGRAFDKESPTFRKGQIGSYLEEFTEEHINLFKSLPQDFMEIYGYKTQIKVERPFILWLTGLLCAGKTTIVRALEKEFLFSSSTPLRILDGDAVRQELSRDLGFSKEDRHTHNLRVAAKASEILKEGTAVCVSLISPYRKTREVVREKIKNFVEVYVKCPIEVCEKRDTKGMYKLAREGKVKSFTGIDDPYEEPLEAEIVVETDRQRLIECIQTILNGLMQLGYIQISKSAIKEKTQQYYLGSIPIDDELSDELSLQNNVSEGSRKIDSKDDIIRRQDKEVKAKESRIIELQNNISDRDSRIEALQGEITSRDDIIRRQDKEVKAKESRIIELQNNISDRDSRIEPLQGEITSRDDVIRRQDKEVKAKDVTDVTSAAWNSEVLQAKGLVMVAFWAEWCKPCETISQMVEELAKEYAGKAKIVRLNIDDNADIASTYKISIIPTITFFKHGQKLHEIICAVPKMQIQDAIESL
jgi:adenylylsulfate kinase